MFTTATIKLRSFQLQALLNLARKTCFISVFFISSVIRSQDQRSYFNPDFVESITQKEGLSSNVVNTMVMDNQGYIWIGTDDGLNRYDGYSFKVFRKQRDDATSIQFEKIKSLTVDIEGNVWVGSTDGQISYYHPATRRFTNFNQPESGLPAEGVQRIFCDRSGNIWACLIKRGLYRLDKQVNRFVHLADLPGIHPIFLSGEHYTPVYNTIYDIHEDKYGFLWLATHNGLYNYNTKNNTFTLVPFKPIVPFKWRDDCFVRLLPDSDGYWISSYGGGLSHYNIKTRKWKTYKFDFENLESPTKNILYDLKWKNAKQIWVCSLDKGWGVFDISSEKFTFFKFPSSIKNALVTEMAIHPSGVLCLSSKLHGLIKYTPDSPSPVFVPVEVNHSMVGDYINTCGFYHDIAEKKLYYGTSGADGLHSRNLETKAEKIIHLGREGSEKTTNVNQLLNDAHDTLWVLTDENLYYLNKKTEALVHYYRPSISTDLFLRSMIRSKSGDFWITSQMGLFRFNPKTKVTTNFRNIPSDATSLCHDNVRGIVEDNNGNIWAVTANGLSIYNPSRNSFSNYFRDKDSATSLGSNNLVSIAINPITDDIWIATVDQGLCQYVSTSKKIEFIHWTTESGLPTNVYYSVAGDSKGTMWTTSPSSLVGIDTTESIKQYRLSTYSPFPISIDQDDNIAIGSYGGYIYFNAYTLQPDVKKTKLVINSFKFFDTEIPLIFDSTETATIELQHNENYISIEYAALDFRDSEKNSYSYKLDGVDEKWVNAGTRRYASYTNLAPNTYQFHLKSSNADGIWTEPGLTIAIRIHPPFWNAWYFKVSIFVFLAAGIVFLFDYRIRKVKHEEKRKSIYTKKIAEVEMRALRAQMNPHFIFNSLNTINRYIIKADPETASLYLTKFSKLIRLILEHSKNSRIVLENEIIALRLYIEMELIRFDHRFSYNIEVLHGLDTMAVEIPPMIFQPYVENAIWHGLLPKTDLGRLDIILEKKEGILICTIEDNGIGREKASKGKNDTLRKKSLGMQITSNRLDLLKEDSKLESSVEIIDLKNENHEAIGTRVIVKIPVIVPAQFVHA